MPVIYCRHLFLCSACRSCLFAFLLSLWSSFAAFLSCFLLALLSYSSSFLTFALSFQATLDRCAAYFALPTSRLSLGQ